MLANYQHVDLTLIRSG